MTRVTAWRVPARACVSARTSRRCERTSPRTRVSTQREGDEAFDKCDFGNLLDPNGDPRFPLYRDDNLDPHGALHYLLRKAQSPPARPRS